MHRSSTRTLKVVTLLLVLVGWFDEPRLRDLAPVVERLADA